MKRGIAFKFAVLLSALIVISLVLVGSLMLNDASRVLRELSLQRLDTSAALGQRYMHKVFDGAVQDLQLLLDSRELSTFANEQSFDRDLLAEQFRMLLLKHAWYSQVRLIGVAEQGRELVRLNRVDDLAQRVPEAQLQEKAHRDYFRAALVVPPGQSYFSQFNLNREFGRLAEPREPTMRVAAPIHSSDGHVVGVLVINIDFRPVFSGLREQLVAGEHLLLANASGEYLQHPDAVRAFAFESGDSFRVQEEFPQLDQLDSTATRLQGEVGSLSGEQVAAFIRVPVPGVGGERELWLGVVESLAGIEAQAQQLLQRSLLLSGLIALLAAGVALLLVWRLVRPLRQMAASVAGFSGDAQLNGLPVERDDEIGLLARSFDDMSTRTQNQLAWLNEERTRLHTLIETAADAIVLINERGLIDDCNQATERLFGYTREELIGNNVSMLMNQGDRQHHDQYLNNYRTSGEARVIGIGRDVVGLHKDGHEIPLYLSVGEFEVDGRVQFTGILHDMSEHIEQQEALRRLATTDALTGIYNRRYFIEQLQYEINRSRRYNNPLSLLLLDLDHFKSFNDRFGHETGDKVLLRAVEVLKEGVRESDTLARLGGDEFAILMPETDLHTATKVAQRLCRTALRTLARRGGDDKLSFSIGVAQADDDPKELMRSADRALYQAKEDGRGRVAVSH